MISLEEARAAIFSALEALPLEEVSLESALGRWAASDIISPSELPAFDNSAMDGYAVRSADTKGASAENPVILRCVGRIAAGEPFEGIVQARTCARLFTGSLLPYGADAVVMQEDARQEGDTVQILDEAKPLENIRMRGEDVRTGTCLVSRGERITATSTGLLAACGVRSVRVSHAPRVALLATGTELREPGEPLLPGQIYESNRTMLQALLREIPASAVRFPLVHDDLKATTDALSTAFESQDVVISTGGVSVGDLDFVKEAFTALGGKIDFWRIAVRPGKPFVFGKLAEKYLFGLPGNPVSAFVTFMTLVRPALLKMQGASMTDLPQFQAELADELSNTGDRRHFMRVRLHAGKVYKAGAQGSHLLGKLGKANGLVDVPPATVLAPGDLVQVQVWDL